MSEVYLASKRAHYKTAFATNSIDSSLTVVNETATEPAGDGVHKIDPLCTGKVASQIRVIPFGDDAANETFNGRVIHWAKDQAKGVWIPTELVTFAVTLGAATLVNTEFFADTIVYTSGIAEADLTIVSPADDTRAWLLLDIMGADKIEFQVDTVLALNGNYYFHAL